MLFPEPLNSLCQGYRQETLTLGPLLPFLGTCPNNLWCPPSPQHPSHGVLPWITGPVSNIFFKIEDFFLFQKACEDIFSAMGHVTRRRIDYYINFLTIMSLLFCYLTGTISLEMGQPSFVSDMLLRLVSLFLSNICTAKLKLNLPCNSSVKWGSSYPHPLPPLFSLATLSSEELWPQEPWAILKANHVLKTQCRKVRIYFFPEGLLPPFYSEGTIGIFFCIYTIILTTFFMFHWQCWRVRTCWPLTVQYIWIQLAS